MYQQLRKDKHLVILGHQTNQCQPLPRLNHNRYKQIPMGSFSCTEARKILGVCFKTIRTRNGPTGALFILSTCDLLQILAFLSRVAQSFSFTENGQTCFYHIMRLQGREGKSAHFRAPRRKVHPCTLIQIIQQPSTNYPGPVPRGRIKFDSIMDSCGPHLIGKFQFETLPTTHAEWDPFPRPYISFVN